MIYALSILTAWTAVIVTALTGWVFNIIALVGMVGEPITTEFILRLVGVPLAVLGAIMGFYG